MINVTLMDLQRNFAYCEETNTLERWNRRHKPHRWTIVENRSNRSDGYCHISFKGSHVRYHRIVFALVHGRIPTLGIDHIDGNELNNHPSNLREVTQSDNMRNQRMRSNNTSGATGVYWDKVRDKWVAQIKTKVGAKHLGYFEKFEDAVLTREQANAKYGFTERHGKELKDA